MAPVTKVKNNKNGVTKKGLPEQKLGKKRVTFKIKAQPQSSVYVSGTFNNWSTTKNRLKLKNKDGGYTLTMALPKGKYEYKFIIDEVWTIDPECTEWTPNNLGSLNSVLHVN